MYIARQERKEEDRNIQKPAQSRTDEHRIGRAHDKDGVDRNKTCSISRVARMSRWERNGPLPARALWVVTQSDQAPVAGSRVRQGEETTSP